VRQTGDTLGRLVALGDAAVWAPQLLASRSVIVATTTGPTQTIRENPAVRLQLFEPIIET
jgi:hypothetical protein